MEQINFITHYDKLLRAFHLHFKNTLQRQRMEELHLLRLSIKGLKAWWSLIELINNGKWETKQNFDQLEELFKTAGQMREVQINLKLVQKHFDPSLLFYAEQQLKTRNHVSDELSEVMQAFDLNAFNQLSNEFRQVIQGLTDDTVFSASTEFVIQKTRKVLKLKNQLPDDHKLHKIRIYQKAIREIMTILLEVKPSPDMQKLLFEINKLNHNLGKWHDYIVLLRSLKQFSKNSYDRSNAREFRKQFKRLKHEQKVRRKKLIKQIDQYTSSYQLKELLKQQ